ncbi:MAG: enoyl-CoA hydratase/isomerase family protein [Rhodospirillales bacterium]
MSAYEDLRGDSSGDLLIETRNGVGLITLNRPRALNALSLDMLRGFRRALAEWSADPTIRAVIVRGAGGRAFCAGGDIRAVYDANLRGDTAFCRALFREEYTLDYEIGTFAKPYIAFMDGIVMGGGCGISVHGRHRIATEKTLLAMPETGIGFFPDVGASYFLPRCPGRIGLYLGLTGARLAAPDILYAGLADALVPSGRLDDLADAVVAGKTPEEAIANFAAEPPASKLETMRPTIDRCFAESDLAGMIGALERAAEAGEPDGETVPARLDGKSPFSLKLSHKLLSIKDNLSLLDSLILDYRLSCRVTARGDFREGVRAVLVDKDSRPQWSPTTIESVNDAEIAACFEPVGSDDLVLP